MLVLAVAAFVAPATAPLAAQELAPVGFVRVVNAVGMPGRLEVKLDGQPVQKQGYEAGTITGLVALAAGALDLEFAHPACRGLNDPVSLGAGDSVALCVHWEPVLDRDGKEIARQLALWRHELSAGEDRKSSFTFISLCKDPLVKLQVLAVGAEKPAEVALAPREPKTLPFSGAPNVIIAAAQGSSTRVAAEKPVHYLVFVFDDPSAPGGRRVVSCPAYKGVDKG
jgi:hypothetical protein